MLHAGSHLPEQRSDFPDSPSLCPISCVSPSARPLHLPPYALAQVQRRGASIRPWPQRVAGLSGYSDAATAPGARGTDWAGRRKLISPATC